MDDELLISLVRSYPAFYDSTNPAYTDQVYKLQAWKHIASQLTLDVNVCKARWNNIRDNFRKSLKKNAAQCEQAKKPRLYKYADQLGFIVEFFDGRMNKGGPKILKEEEEFDGDVEVEEEEEEFDGNVEVEEEEEVEIKSEISESIAEFSNESLQFESTPAVPEVKLGKRINLARESLCSNTSVSVPVPVSTMERSATCRFEEHDTGTITQSPHPVDAFLAGIAPTLKSFSPYYLNLAKSEIFATVQKYEMRMLEQQLAYGKPRSCFGDVVIMAPSTSTSRSDSTSPPKEIYED